jgi:predicted site-specific integrase-resolvase
MSTSETNQHSAVLYLRVASADQQDQRDACVREAKRLGAVITAEFVDVGGSAR